MSKTSLWINATIQYSFRTNQVYGDPCKQVTLRVGPSRDFICVTESRYIHVQVYVDKLKSVSIPMDIKVREFSIIIRSM